MTLVEYGDYQSPSCMAAARELEKLRKRFDVSTCDVDGRSRGAEAATRCVASSPLMTRAERVCASGTVR